MTDRVEWPTPDHPQGLGEPERIYRQAVMPKATTFLRLLLLLALLAAIGYGAYQLIHASSLWPEASRTCYLPIALLMLAFCALFLAAPALQRYGQLRVQRRDIVVTCSDGIAYYHDGNWHQANWNEIIEIKTQEETAGKDLMKEGTQGGNDLLWPIFWGTIGGLWTLLGGDYRKYVITTKAGVQIELGETLSRFDELIATIYRRTDAPLARSK